MPDVPILIVDDPGDNSTENSKSINNQKDKWLEPELLKSQKIWTKDGVTLVDGRKQFGSINEMVSFGALLERVFRQIDKPSS